MDFELIPFKEIQKEITVQANPKMAFRNILQAAGKNCPALDWDQFSVDHMDIDIRAASHWITETITGMPNVKGIYLGLDTLNMAKGRGTNVEMGMNCSCDPAIISSDWAFACDAYGPTT